MKEIQQPVVRKAIENRTSGQTRLRGPLKNARGFYAAPPPTIYDPSRPRHDGKPMTVALAGLPVRLCDRDQHVGHACAQRPGGMRGVCGSDTVSAGHSVMMKTRDPTVAVTCHLEPTQNLYHPLKLPEK